MAAQGHGREDRPEEPEKQPFRVLESPPARHGARVGKDLKGASVRNDNRLFAASVFARERPTLFELEL